MTAPPPAAPQKIDAAPLAPWAEPRIDVGDTPRIDAGDTWAHARRLLEGEYDTQVARFLGAYLDLLWLDHTVAEMLFAFPGAPATNRYGSFTYKWKLPDLERLEKVLRRADATTRHPIGEPTETDRAVSAYTTQLLATWPMLRELADYYRTQTFVDDEFAKGRREAPLVAEAIRALAPLRRPMTESIFAGWRAAAGDKPDSPRALVGASFEACMRAAWLIFESSGKRSDAAAQAMDTAMSACRRGVGAVSALPPDYASFAKPLRTAAVAFGDSMNADWARQYAVDDVERLVTAYIEHWPKLPAEPAEKPPDR